ncbi:hypothetical protein MJO28_002870 [Puccinia striiformis f. sp. tritici]|uniref:Uncharacterized protein n=2 Tax=Puccinia striiformis f. sp. tritici TaxID=168172 RepID=A0A0L0VKC8_9BASI|nr:hypothetical protein Pst134EA_005183 [Puccinia striiformis f. sp. tritici]KAH9471276.1 hypothetical protein Pst134EA_005183 [Puccinia striiformis f. sp. tritici]KAI7959079.1 hypothetical protein MJO28_002870 [Puccinia striiformis f. sp. tritici]KAI7964841.1 hypothetical protein MJO29_002939 [Puccinia striiformis f. sp. tritici]KNE99671.1 hypothetical protein PSTG_07164 [Puccinia striiformis f. sp. tritici PST-78]
MTARPGGCSTNQQPGVSDSLLASKIPLIRAPGTWLPKPITRPNDLHPLPDDVTAYFVYPYTLEPSSLRYLNGLSTHPTNWEATLQSTQTYLDERRARKEAERTRIENEKELVRLESLRLVAPGWNGAMESILSAPSSSTTPIPSSTAPGISSNLSTATHKPNPSGSSQNKVQGPELL